jgi:hypothetical protein
MMLHRTHLAFGVVLCAILAPHVRAASAEPPTHAAVEIYPGLMAVLAGAAEYPFRMVTYDGGDARSALPPKGRWGAGEHGHLKHLELSLDGPGDVSLRFESEQVSPNQAKPIARLQMTLRGPAEAEWWSKLPVQSDWGLVKRFREPIVLLVKAKAEVCVSKTRAGAPQVSLAFARLTGGDVELNVRHCPPWLDRLIETQFDVVDQVNLHIAQDMAPKAHLELPSLSVPYLAKPLVIEDLRPMVRNGVLRVEMTVGSR